MKKLVQISSGSWVDPDDIKRIYTCSSYQDGEPDHTYVVCNGMSSGLGLFGGDSTDHVICCDWPIERIHNALGLTDADSLDAQFGDES